MNQQEIQELREIVEANQRWIDDRKAARKRAKAIAPPQTDPVPVPTVPTVPTPPEKTASWSWTVARWLCVFFFISVCQFFGLILTLIKAIWWICQAFYKGYNCISTLLFVLCSILDSYSPGLKCSAWTSTGAGYLDFRRLHWGDSGDFPPNGTGPPGSRILKFSPSGPGILRHTPPGQRIFRPNPLKPHIQGLVPTEPVGRPNLIHAANLSKGGVCWTEKPEQPWLTCQWSPLWVQTMNRAANSSQGDVCWTDNQPLPWLTCPWNPPAAVARNESVCPAEHTQPDRTPEDVVAVARNESMCPAEHTQPDRTSEDVVPSSGNKQVSMQDLFMPRDLMWPLGVAMVIVVNTIARKQGLTVAAG